MDTADVRYFLRDQAENTAEWREGKAVEFPDDTRNREAVTLLKQIAATMDAVPDVLLLPCARVFSDDDSGLKLKETESEMFREVGFRRFSENATEFVKGLSEKAEELLEDGRADTVSELMAAALKGNPARR